MISRFLIIFALANIAACSRPSIEFVDASEITFHDVKIILPNKGLGHFKITPTSLTWQKESITLEFSDLTEDKIEILRNSDKIGEALRGQSVVFSDDGRIAIPK